MTGNDEFGLRDLKGEFTEFVSEMSSQGIQYLCENDDNLEQIGFFTEMFHPTHDIYTDVEPYDDFIKEFKSEDKMSDRDFFD